MKKTLYPEIEPYRVFWLNTGSQHAVYVEQSGNPEGVPVIFLHGGPCSGTRPDQRRFFNPDYYRIILFDQRGSGKSLPFGELDGNTTQDLIADIERIRAQLGIKQWLVFGGSWGGALALLYAQQQPAAVLGLVIRAVFLARQKDVDWFIKDGGSARIYPECWQNLMAALPPASLDDPVTGLYAQLTGDDDRAATAAAQAWSAWSAQAALGNAYQPASGESVSEKALKQARMELHYAWHRYFIDENQILADCTRLQAIPTRIIHGRQDLLCPLDAGFALHQALPHADWVVLPNAGHVAQGDEMIDALVSATDHFAEVGHF